MRQNVRRECLKKQAFATKIASLPQNDPFSLSQIPTVCRVANPLIGDTSELDINPFAPDDV